MASIVSAAIDVVLASPDQLPTRIAVLEDALQQNPRAAAALAEARAALGPTEWTEKTVADALSARLRPSATITKTQAAAIRASVGSALASGELDSLLTDLKTAKGPRNIARLVSRYDGQVVARIIGALTE